MFGASATARSLTLEEAAQAKCASRFLPARRTKSRGRVQTTLSVLGAIWLLVQAALGRQFPRAAQQVYPTTTRRPRRPTTPTWSSEPHDGPGLLVMACLRLFKWFSFGYAEGSRKPNCIIMLRLRFSFRVLLFRAHRPLFSILHRVPFFPEHSVYY